MAQFLNLVAKVYIENELQNLSDYTFIFPNKRCGVFFTNYLSKMAPTSIILPKIKTISEFISAFSKSIEASRLELLFILYDVYRNIVLDKSKESNVIDFDKFQFWAEMILNDFNDADKYLVDAKQLFANVKNLKEISSNFLTEEQIDVINKFWGETYHIEDISSFWKHIQHADEGDALSHQFIKLWEILFELYSSFKERLNSMGLCYQGMLYRQVAENIKTNYVDKLDSKRYIFVGFNVMSFSEIKIFEQLKTIGRADFYWDFNSPAYVYKENRATRFVGKYVTQFKSLYKIEEELITKFPSINVIGVPSNVGQVKEASSIISQLEVNGEISGVNTAIVFPDENLFIPMLHSLPEKINNVNITMGFPLRHTSIASLVVNVTSMQLRARIVQGEYQFFYEDILNILSHPIINSIAYEESRDLMRHIKNNRIFNISSDYIKENYSKLSVIFTAVKNLNKTKDVLDYLKSLVLWIRPQLQDEKVLDKLLIDKYFDGLCVLERLLDKYNISINDRSVFHIVERTLSFETINFVGEPLSGLQMMGVLETRALDFDNIVILSMNEKVFPRKHYAKTFIPDTLRKGYGMSTIAFQESMYAYYFYRMIARAKNVYIMYDARTGGLSSGEMSRYLYQLKFLYPHDNINFSMINYNVISPQKEKLTINKNKEIIEKLKIYKDPNSERYLSASALNTYISCPLSFYLQYVEGIHQDDEIVEYMDEGTYGTIMHEVAEQIYMHLKGTSDEVKITSELLDSLKNRQIDIKRLIIQSVNYHYNKLGRDNDTPLQGEAKVISDIMLYFIQLLFENEKQFTEFYFVDAEKKCFGQWKINDEHTINFKQIIDRIDKVFENGQYLIRLVDYKTGKDKVDLASIEDLFDKDKEDRRKAIFQLFVYCCYYAYYTGYKGDIRPYIYTYKTLNTEHLPPIKVENRVLNGYLEYKDQFWALFEELINEIFDETIPFKSATHEDACHYCKFMDICNKES